MYPYISAYYNPRKLLNNRWQTFHYRKQMGFILLLLFVVLNSLLINLWNFVTECFVAEPKVAKKPTKFEKEMNSNMHTD